MTSSQDYFLRLVCLQVDGVTQVLRDLLRCCVSSKKKIDVSRLTDAHVGDHIRSLERHWRDSTYLKPDQIKLLLPTNGHCNINELDITLLCAVLLDGTACNTGRSERGNIKDLKGSRGRTYAHAPHTGVDRSTFDQIWKDVVRNLQELAVVIETKGIHGYKQTVEDNIKNFKRSPYTELKVKMTETLMQWIQLQSVENRRSKVMKNLFEKSETYIKDKTRAQSAAACVLRSSTLFGDLQEALRNNPVALTGMDKEIVMLLAKELVNIVKGENEKCIVRKVSEDWSAVDIKDIDVLLLRVDAIDTYWLEWSTLKKYCLEEKSLKLIMIYTENTKNDIKRVFQPCYFKDVTPDIFTYDDKVNILEQLLTEKHHIPIETCLNKFLTPIGFLQICQDPLFGIDTQTLFEAPFKSLETVLDEFIRSCGSSTMTLSLFVLFLYEGQLDLSNMPANHDNYLLDKLETRSDLRPKDLKKDFENLHNVVVKRTDTVTIFLPMMYEVVAMKYARENPEKAIECCKLEFLRKHVAFGQRNEIKVLVNLDNNPSIIRNVANRLLEGISSLIRKNTNQNGIDQDTADEIRHLLTHRPFSNERVIAVFLDSLTETSAKTTDSFPIAEDTSAITAVTCVDKLYCAVLHESSDIVNTIIASRNQEKTWDEKSKVVGFAVLEAYLSPTRNIYDILIASGTLTILQYLAVFAKEGYNTSLKRLVQHIKQKDWDKNSQCVRDALKSALALKDSALCESIMDKGVVFDTAFVCEAVLTGDIKLIKQVVKHLKTVLKGDIDSLCSELTEAMVNTDSPNYKDVCNYLITHGAMCPFKLIHNKVVNDKNFVSAGEIIQKLSKAGKIKSGKDTQSYKQKTVVWLLDNWHNHGRKDIDRVLEPLLDSGVMLVQEILDRVPQTKDLMFKQKMESRAKMQRDPLPTTTLVDDQAFNECDDW